MQTLFTNDFCKLGHPEFIICTEDDILDKDIEGFKLYLKESVQQGTVFSSGQTLQYGSMIIRINDQDGFLIFEEPNMIDIPVQWNLGISCTLKIFNLQNCVLNKLKGSFEKNFPSIRQSLFMGIDVDNTSKDIFMERSDEDNNDSGWFIGNSLSNLSYDNYKNIKCLSLYECYINFPHLIKYFSLPKSLLVKICNDCVEIESKDPRVII